MRALAVRKRVNSGEHNGGCGDLQSEGRSLVGKRFVIKSHFQKVDNVIRHPVDSECRQHGTRFSLHSKISASED